jgi:uncharacterized FAD-dependent dehydrogenase
MTTYLVRNIAVPLSAHPDPLTALCAKLRIAPACVESFEIRRRAIDARKKGALRYDYTVSVIFSGNVPQHPDIAPDTIPEPEALPQVTLHDPQPLIIGMGPAGLFAALTLVERGFRPVIIDRGDSVEERRKTVGKLWGTGELDPESNVQFGEGGAGTFSDGKLTARNRNPFSEKVFEYLIRFGADASIAWEALPHLGTDGLVGVLHAMRLYLEGHGAQFRFRTRLDGVVLRDGRITSVSLNGESISPEVILLGIGNGAHDTFRLLREEGIPIIAKPFAVGLRIEHPQDYINSAFYGAGTDFSLTGPATYRLTAKTGERGVYTFCMCPGGMVVCASSETDGLVTNGMSNHARDSRFGNSAVVVTVNDRDFGRNTLNGIAFRRRIETACFDPLYPQIAPAQSAAAFIRSEKRGLGRVSYRPGVRAADISALFPREIARALAQGLAQWGKRIPGFIENGMVIAPETRTSSPVRILRDEYRLCSTVATNLYPIGEGAGYAGGIISSAADGCRTASLFGTD